LAVCSGSASLDPGERAELLTVLAEDGDELIRERAGGALTSQQIESFVIALKGDAPAVQLFRHCGRSLVEDPAIAAALAKNWHCPPQFLPAACKRLPTSAVQELMLDLDRLSAQPALAGALLQSASLTADQHQQLEELLREDLPPADTFANAVENDLDPEKRVTLIQRLSRMRIVERVQCALKGNREERVALIRDPCKVVQRAVLQSPRITEREIEGFAGMANLSDEVLRAISMMRKYAKNYIVTRNLLNNPKTPIDVSLHLLPKVNAQDLKSLQGNKNIPETLKSAANRLQRQREAARKTE
jgi:hypothetical protein